ncbi:hypothetical protein [Akkermansia sp.]|uniref:hypothetical protein n=1 Tax=Akkermansia sp. TaxID=1872421 RepID=UPI0025BB7D45|nr:hypothetical protein [Akkermansia sp.]MCC8148087.1 hypothetical protein [Akkermansia sp.]
MRILPILVITCLLGSVPFVHGQSRTTANPEAPKPETNAPAADTVDKSLSPASVNGIRFVLKAPMALPSPIYMPIDSKRLEKVEIRAALPGRRSVYPKSKIITLFGGLDQKGMPTNKLVSKPLPTDLGPKTLALVGKNSSGEITLDFINEAELPMNCVYIQNLTGRTFTLELPKPPTGEKSVIELPSKSTYIFGKDAIDSNVSRTTPANLTYMTRLKNGKVVKVKDRGMMLTTYPGRKVVMIISPDSSGRTVVLTELMIFKEKPATASAGK